MADTGSDTAGWITAVSTALTAILTGTGGLAAWLALRRDKQRELPIVERTVVWKDTYLFLEVTVRNRLPETITLDRITVSKPRGATISEPFGPRYNPYGEASPPERGESATMVAGYSVKPSGTAWSQHGGGDVGYFSFAVWPPASWNGGMLRADLRISSKADTIRDRRITISISTPARPSKQTDEKASMSG